MKIIQIILNGSTNQQTQLIVVKIKLSSRNNYNLNVIYCVLKSERLQELISIAQISHSITTPQRTSPL
jgi:hypothetical protein